MANDESYAFEVATNPSDGARRIAAFDVRLGRRTIRTSSFVLAARAVRVVPIGVAMREIAQAPAPPAGTPPSFADPDATVLKNAHLAVSFAPFAGARIAELGAGTVDTATSIGLLRDAVAPEPPPSPRDYIASYTHPLPAGTFNRRYSCVNGDAAGMQRVTCSYDAPDLLRGGALFSRTLTLRDGSDTLVVDESFAPNDPHSNARLESISGFALQAGDAVLRSRDRRTLGILHADQLTELHWRQGDVATVELRETRGAELVTLIFARRTVEMSLRVVTAASRGEARRLLDANQA
jgi:hypothetical protein